MCGIAAVFHYGASRKVDRDELCRVRDHMACRGPDGSGVWLSDDGRAGLAHRRLSIIDLSDRAAQPMKGEDKLRVITFNGEIYNYRELRAALTAKGYAFSTESDTEVLLQLYAEKGEAMVHDLSGMFAFVIWDEERQSLFAARDPFGIKPLYYADDGTTIRISSEVKALVAGGQVDTAPEPAGHVGYFILGSVPEPFTFYKGIRSLPAGSTMRVSAANGVRITKYWEVSEVLGSADAPSNGGSNVAEELRDAVVDSVRRHLVADVDVGVFLSAGLDSATIAAVASELGGSLRTVTLGFEEFRGQEIDETPLAEEVARHYGARHATVWVTSKDFAQEREKLIGRMDQPTIDGVNTYFVARAAASTGLKVALSGLGGDELFGGYPSFREIPALVRTLEPIPFVASVGRALRGLAAPIISRITSPKYASTLEYGSSWNTAYLLRRGLYMPWELSQFLDGDLVDAGLRDLALNDRLAASIEAVSSARAKVSALETSWYMRNQLLRDTDWASMSSSLEVRVPFVDRQFWERVALLLATTGTGKTALAAVPARTLPPAILSRPKTGFGIPVREWLMHDEDPRYAGRGLRGWARFVYDHAA